MGDEKESLPPGRGVFELHHLDAWLNLFRKAHNAIQADLDAIAAEAEAQAARRTREEQSSETLGELREAAREMFQLDIAEDATISDTLERLSVHAKANNALSRWYTLLKTQWAAYCTALLRHLDRAFLVSQEARYGTRAFESITARITFSDAMLGLWPGGAPMPLVQAAAQIHPDEAAEFPLIANPFATPKSRPVKRKRTAERTVLRSFDADVTSAWGRGAEMSATAYHSEVLVPRLAELQRHADALCEEIKTAPAPVSDAPIGSFTHAPDQTDHLRRLATMFAAHVAEVFPRHRTWATLSVELDGMLETVRRETDEAHANFQRLVAAADTAEKLHIAPFVLMLSLTCTRDLDAILARLDAPPLRDRLVSGTRETIRGVHRAFTEEREDANTGHLPELVLSDAIRESVRVLVNLGPDAHPSLLASRTWRAQLFVCATQLDYSRMRMDRLLRFLRAAGAGPPSRWPDTWTGLCVVESTDVRALAQARQLDGKLMESATATRFRTNAANAVQSVRAALARALRDPPESLAPPPRATPIIDAVSLANGFAPFLDALVDVHSACKPFASASPHIQTWMRELRKVSNQADGSLTLYFSVVRYVSAALHLVELLPRPASPAAPPPPEPSERRPGRGLLFDPE